MNLKQELFKNQPSENLKPKDFGVLQYFICEEYEIENDKIYSLVTLDDLVLLSGKSKSTCSNRVNTLAGANLIEVTKKIMNPNRFVIGYVINGKNEFFYKQQLIAGLNLKQTTVPKNLESKFTQKHVQSKAVSLSSLINKCETLFFRKTGIPEKVGSTKNALKDLYAIEKNDTDKIVSVLEYMIDNKKQYTFLIGKLSFIHFVKFYRVFSSDYEMFITYSELNTWITSVKKLFKDTLKNNYKEKLTNTELCRMAITLSENTETPLDDMYNILEHYVKNCLLEDFKFIRDAPNFKTFEKFFTSIFWHYKGHIGTIQPQVEPEHIDYKFDVL